MSDRIPHLNVVVVVSCIAYFIVVISGPDEFDFFL